jgi:hypothetical protein
MFVSTESLDVAALTALIAASAPLHTVQMGLFTNSFSPTRTTPLTAYIEPVYTGYARQTLVWGSVGRDNRNLIGSTANILTFQMANANTPTTIYGYFLVASESTGSGGNEALGGELFASPVNLSDSLDLLNISFEYIETNAQQGVSTLVE